MTWGRWLHAGLGAIAMLLATTIVVQGEMNRSAAAAAEVQRVELVRTQQFAQVDNALVQILAKTAAERNDPALRALLAANGVTFNVGLEAAK